MRVNGLEDTRRRDKIPMRLLLGDLPATVGAEDGPTRRLFGDLSGITGVDGTSALRFCSLAGVFMGRVIALGVEMMFVRTKCDVVCGFSRSILLFLDFLLDDWKIEGSMFSELWSSNSCGAFRLRDDDVVERAGCNVSI